MHVVCTTCGSDDLDVLNEKDYGPNGPGLVYTAACRECDCASSHQAEARIRLRVRR